MYDIALIKNRISCVQYAQSAGLPIQKDGDRCRSPLRIGSQNKHSFIVRNDFWYDYGSQNSGDVIDLCALLKHNGDRGLAITELARLTGVQSDTDYPDWVQSTQKRCNQIATWHSNLREQDREYLHKRRITDETIERLKIGFNEGRIVIPFYKNGYCVSWIGRSVGSLEPKYLKKTNDKLSESAPWGLHTLDRKTDKLYIGQGTFDALSLDQSGCSVIATMGGQFPKNIFKMVLGICKNYQTVVLTFDNDEAGRTFTMALGTSLFANRIPFEVAIIPAPHKDISEYYAAGGEIENLKLEDGATHLALSIRDKEKFQDFARRAARIMSRANLGELFFKLIEKETFSPAWLREIQKSCHQAPPEPIIIKEILEKHQLAYLDNVGFYEYNNHRGVWVLLSDRVIDGYISDTLGTFASGNKLNPIKNLMKPNVLTEQDFDKKPLINFINGTLELETGVFRESASEDMCSKQLPYPYIADAKCPSWRTFLEQIAAEDGKRVELLQYIAGYALFQDCPHEKIFVLTGEGGNGKSRYTMVLQELFGRENVTNITPKGLMEDFQCVHLRDSLLNIAGEIKNDVSGSEERMKQIASGEPIRACYKGKDYVTFSPRCKLIYACNGQLKSSDTSEGLTRRLVIIDFPCRFVDNPDPADPYQKPKDINLLPKLLGEISGIFNWAYEGYQELKEVGYFTETDENVEIMKAFRMASNPIEVFYDDFMDSPPNRISKQTLYERYSQWCASTNHKPMADNNFHREFQKISRKDFQQFEKSQRVEGVIRKERGYEYLHAELSIPMQTTLL